MTGLSPPRSDKQFDAAHARNVTRFMPGSRLPTVVVPALAAVSEPPKMCRGKFFTPRCEQLYFAALIDMEAKTKTIEQFKTHAKDTGSADVQVALLTQRIEHLTEHLKTNKKDHSSRRGLLMMVGQRRRLLEYLQTIDLGRYQAVTKKLKLRH
jgi:small subunit ribosomal protein S15